MRQRTSGQALVLVAIILPVLLGLLLVGLDLAGRRMREREVQDALEFDADVAHADMQRIQAERRRAVIETAQRRLGRVEELKALKAKIEAMRLIGKTGVQMRLDVLAVTDEGSFCHAWPIVPVEIPGKRDLSGAPLTKPGIKQQTPDRVFVYGLTDPLRGRPLVKIVYPIDSQNGPKGTLPYAIETEIVWLKSQKAAEAKASLVSAE